MNKILVDNMFSTSPLLSALRRNNAWKISAEPDKFEVYVRKIRAEAGIIDPPPPDQIDYDRLEEAYYRATQETPPNQPVWGGGRVIEENLVLGDEDP